MSESLGRGLAVAEVSPPHIHWQIITPVINATEYIKPIPVTFPLILKIFFYVVCVPFVPQEKF